MPVKVLLETRDVNVEAEDLSGEGMLGGQGFGAPDALLPEGFRPRADYGALASRKQPGAFAVLFRENPDCQSPASASVFPPRGFTIICFAHSSSFCSPGGLYEAHPWKTCRSQKRFRTITE